MRQLKTRKITLNRQFSTSGLKKAADEDLSTFFQQTLVGNPCS